jgi:hypothetical protein
VVAAGHQSYCKEVQSSSSSSRKHKHVQIGINLEGLEVAAQTCLVVAMDHQNYCWTQESKREKVGSKMQKQSRQGLSDAGSSTCALWHRAPGAFGVTAALSASQFL